jgi:hypothetical protein
MKYYIYNTLELGQEASAAIYDLNAPPRDERSTLYAYGFIPHESNDTVVMEWIDMGFDDGDILDGLTPLTPEQAVKEGYLIND